MIQAIDEHQIRCPYCGEMIIVLIEKLAYRQNYIEDCQVCCRPIVFDITIDLHGMMRIDVFTDND